MEMSKKNSSYSLKKIHPIILKNDNKLYQKFINDKTMTMTSRSKKIYFPNDINSKITDNIKTLFYPCFARINKFKKIFNLKVNNTNNNLNTFKTINNVNSNLHLKNTLFKDGFDFKNSNKVKRVKTPNNKQFNNHKKEKINKGTNISNDSNEKKIITITIILIKN